MLRKPYVVAAAYLTMPYLGEEIITLNRAPQASIRNTTFTESPIYNELQTKTYMIKSVQYTKR